MARENEDIILAEIEKLIITEDTDEEIYEDSLENQSHNVKNTEEPVAIERVIWHITDDDDEGQDESQNEEPVTEEEKNETANNSADSPKVEEKPVPT